MPATHNSYGFGSTPNGPTKQPGSWPDYRVFYSQLVHRLLTACAQVTNRLIHSLQVIHRVIHNPQVIHSLSTELSTRAIVHGCGWQILGLTVQILPHCDSECDVFAFWKYSFAHPPRASRIIALRNIPVSLCALVLLVCIIASVWAGVWETLDFDRSMADLAKMTV